MSYVVPVEQRPFVTERTTGLVGGAAQRATAATPQALGPRAGRELL
jgi:hypothetical protein